MEDKNSESRKYTCGFEYTIDMISGRWKSLVLWYLSNGTLRYGELKRLLGTITQKMLTQTLRDLESNGLISRKVYPVVPPKVEYSLTKEGKELIPVFKMLQEWGVKVGGEKNILTPCAIDKYVKGKK